MKATRLPSGSWRCLVYCGRDEDGKQIRKSFTGPDKRRVMAEATAYANEHRTVRRPVTVGECIDSFLDARKSSLSPSTYRGYRSIQRALSNASEAILARSAYDLSAEDIQKAADGWLAAGVEPIYIAERSGHATLGTMKRYEHILAARRREVNDKVLETFSSVTS